VCILTDDLSIGEDMNREIDVNHKQGLLFPPYLDDLLADDHPARFINEYALQVNLEKYGIKQPQSEQGGLFYSPRLLLKVWLYGMFENIRSVRKLEKACHNDIGMLWLTGMHYPDHNTIWRFWVDNKKAIKALFKDTVIVANEMGLLGLVLHAVDGTKILTKASQRGGMNRKQLEHLLAKLDTVIEELTADLEANEANDPAKEYLLPEHLQEKKILRQQVKTALQHLDNIQRDNLNPKDLDCRMMRMNNDTRAFGYNGQVVVDADSGIIVAAEVSQDESDRNLLVPMLEQVKEVMGTSAQDTVADGGYFSGQQLQEASEQGHSVIVNMASGEGYKKAQDNYPKEMFKYDQEQDWVICPHGKRLIFEGEQRNRKNTYNYRIYRCKDSKHCQSRYQCSRNKRGRTLRINPYELTLRRQKEKQDNSWAQALLKKRKSIVEPVFGIIKHNYSFRRFTTSGLANVEAQWLFICLAYNLHKIYRHWAMN